MDDIGDLRTFGGVTLGCETFFEDAFGVFNAGEALPDF